jgi:hypothetical protein
MMLSTPFEDQEFARAMGAKGAAEREDRLSDRIFTTNHRGLPLTKFFMDP